MSSPYNPPYKGEDFICYVALQSMTAQGSFKANPTIAAGDFKVSKDGGDFANLETLPSVAPAAGVSVKLTLSATEMNADNVVVVGIDQTTTKEWADFFMDIVTIA